MILPKKLPGLSATTNISAETFSIPAVNKYDENTIFEKNLKDFFVQHGFSEVINNPFMNIKHIIS